MIKKIAFLGIVAVVLASFAIPVLYFDAQSRGKIGNVETIAVGQANTMQDEIDSLEYMLNLAQTVEVLSNGSGIQPAENIPISEKSPEQILTLVEKELETLVDLGVKIPAGFALDAAPVAMVAKGEKHNFFVWEFIYTLESGEKFILIYSSSLGKILYLDASFGDYTLKEQADLIIAIGEYYIQAGEQSSEMKIYQKNMQYINILNEDIGVHLSFVNQMNYTMLIIHPDDMDLEDYYTQVPLPTPKV